ncbi:MAG TPA: zinc-dependent metalloprotease [Actinomycetota bacterium]|nr:zinc-dependent metalloprotease [Actinomycetota bacterium]
MKEPNRRVRAEVMEAVDWDMHEQDPSAGLVDWKLASSIGGRLTGTAPPLAAPERARLSEDFAELVPAAERMVADFTGLRPEGYRARAWVLSRSQWIDQNLRGFQTVLEPLAARVLGRRSQGGSVRRKGLGLQIGVLMGYVSRKVLGQYDLFLPPDDDGLLYFVGPNVIQVERQMRFRKRDFRLWISLHEVTHRVQFGSVPWLRNHLTGQVDAYLDSVELDSKRVVEALRRAAEQVRSGERHGQDLIFLFMTEQQREILGRVQALMSLLEGHANYVMDVLGAEKVPGADRMRRGLHDRRKSSGIERSFQRLIGFESKVRQYDVGQRFVAQVVDRTGMAGFNRVWDSPANLPSLEEVMAPDRWLARVGPPATPD